ncbi:MAG: amino acid ABC transporter substrate-binding protein [Nitrospirota bacterium]|nr:amino acid ABC transporter substrate-binding protein [Nitrospirota bacterium]
MWFFLVRSFLAGTAIPLFFFFIFLFSRGAAAQSPVQQPVRIGLTLGLSGKYAQLAGYQEKGYRLWQQDVNRRGGIFGRPVELMLLDDKSDPATAARLYQHLIAEERVDLVFSPFSSDISEAVLPVTAKNGYPLILAGASSDHLFQQGYDHVFGLFVPSSKFALGFLEMLVQHRIDGIAVFSDDSLFSRSLVEGIRKWSVRLGLKVVVDEKIVKGSGHFDALARRARDAGAKVVVLASYLEDAVALRRAFTAIKWLPRAYYVPVGPGTGEYQKALGQDSDLVFSTSQWEFHGKQSRNQPDVFVKAFEATYGQRPSYFAATAYAAGQLLENAVRQTGSLERSRISHALAILDAVTVIGRYGVDRTGTQVKQFYLIVQVQEGKFEVVWPPESLTAAPRFL